MARFKRAIKVQKPTEYNARAIAIRNFVLQHPSGDVKELQGYWAKLKPIPCKLPNEAKIARWIYGARSQLRTRYGMEVDKIPWSSPTAMTKLVLTRHNKDWGFRQVANFLAMDGIKLHDNLFYVARKAVQKEYPTVAAELAVTESPDPNQALGPRKGKQKGKKTADADKVVATRDVWESVESDLDNIIRRTDNLRHTEFNAYLKKLRRIASSKVLQLS
jgi:hypothetical protein